jgi:trehalose utilization protein
MVTALGVFFLQPHMMFHGQRHLFGWQSVFRLSKQEQMNIAMPGRHEEIRSVMDQLKNNGVRQILVDGHDSPNYGLLRQLRLSFPQVILRSGQAQHPGQADAIVDASATPVVTGSGELKNYQLLWSGKFYSLYLRHP